MDFLANDEDYYSIADEKFDFDVSLSPASSGGDDDEEVFINPMHRRENCISAGVECLAKGSVGSEPSCSPLTGDNFESVCEEAKQLAHQLAQEQASDATELSQGTRAQSNTGPPGEQFVQCPEDKLGLFSRPPGTGFSPIKRETFCVQDSPMKQLPPTIQRRLLKGSGATGSSSMAAKPKSRLSTSSLSTSSPMGAAKTQQRMVLRAGLGGSRVLPNKPAPPPTCSTLSATKTQRVAPAVKPARLAPPGKAALVRKSSSLQRGSSWAASCEDLASDASDSSLNSSLQDRRSRSAASKNGPAGKALPPQARKGAEQRKNTSSSSSSMSSFNSSTSASPAGKPSSSLNSSTDAARLVNAVPGVSRTRRSTVYAKATEPQVPPPSSTRRSVSATARGPSEISRRPSDVSRRPPDISRRPSEVARSTPLKRAAPSTPLAYTPAKRLMERASSVPSAGARASTTKPKALVAPTPTGHLRRLGELGGVSSPDVPRSMRPKRLVSIGTVDSLQRAVEEPSTPSSAGSKALPTGLRRPSALPTPVGRRLSSAAAMTPRSLSRIALPSVKPAGGTSVKEQPFASAIQPFSLDEDEPAPPSPQTGSQGPESPSATDGPQGPPSPSESQEPSGPSHENQGPNKDLLDLSSGKDPPATEQGKNQEVVEVLLVDVPAPVVRPEEKLLIDLSNTPDLIRTNPVKPCGGGQLIDLSSPLIKWSPEDKKENATNNAPLINLSF